MKSKLIYNTSLIRFNSEVEEFINKIYIKVIDLSITYDGERYVAIILYEVL